MRKAVRWTTFAAFCILAFTMRTYGQAAQPAQFVVDAIVQKDAPLQIVEIKANGDNLLGTVVLKNTTDHYIQKFNIAWSVFRPTNCADGGPAPILELKTESHQLYARVPGPPQPDTSGDRVLKPHEQIEVTSLSLTRKDLQDLAKKNKAKKIRVQVAIAWVNFTNSDNLIEHNGPPDWFDGTVIKMGIFDTDDAGKQACE
jgi:hypothetical protein